MIGDTGRFPDVQVTFTAIHLGVNGSRRTAIIHRAGKLIDGAIIVCDQRRITGLPVSIEIAGSAAIVMITSPVAGALA